MTAMIGHNGGPRLIDDITGASEDARTESEGWLDGTPVETEGQMNAVDALRKAMRGARIELEAGQKAEAAPLYAAYQAANARWKPTIEDYKRIESGLVALVDGFKRKLVAEKEAATRAAYAEARRIEAEARAAAEAANPADIAAQRDVAEKQAAAAAAIDAAQAARDDTVKGMRKVQRHEVVDMRALVNWIAANDKDAMADFANAYAAKHHKNIPDAVVRSWEEREAY